MAEGLLLPGELGERFGALMDILTTSTHFQWAAQQADVIPTCINRGLPNTNSRIK